MSLLPVVLKSESVYSLRALHLERSIAKSKWHWPLEIGSLDPDLVSHWSSRHGSDHVVDRTLKGDVPRIQARIIKDGVNLVLAQF